jgi:hypothetical protein
MPIYRFSGVIEESCPVCGGTGVMEKDPYDIEDWNHHGCPELSKEDANSPVYGCKNCHATGYVKPEKISVVSVTPKIIVKYSLSIVNKVTEKAQP